MISSQPTNIQLSSFDANLFGCFNFYAVDLGAEEANKKCKHLSKIENFSDPSFSACNHFLQPSRAEWKAVIADRCLDLSKKFQFHSPSFQSCVEYLSISIKGKNTPEKKRLVEQATMKCTEFNSPIDFAGKSFTGCFSLYGGNRYPLHHKEAEESIEIARSCIDKVANYDFSNRKVYDCWYKNRINKLDRKLLVDQCVRENP